MIRKFKKGLACALVAALTFAAAAPVTVDAANSPTEAPAPKPEKNVASEKKDGAIATVNTKADGTAAVTKLKTSRKDVKVASTVTVNGVKYKVTVIGANTFANCKKATKVTIPSTVTKINSKAFTGAKKLKTIVLKNNKVKVQKNAFKGLKTSKMTIKVKKMSSKKFKAFKNALKKAGFKGKVKMY